jgi:hypothetical protein
MAAEPRKLGKYGVLSREVMREIIRKAHEACKREVTFARHVIGGTFGGNPRVSLRRSRSAYITCVKTKIQQAVDEKLRELAGAR